MVETTIEWTDATWNPVAGCTVVSSGCTNCYAMRMAARLEAMGQLKYQGLTRKSGTKIVWTGRVFLDELALSAPEKWRSSRLVFVNSMSDLFHESISEEFIEKVWKVMADTPQHTYQVLTKRPSRASEILRRRFSIVLPNVWIGVSVESSEVLDRLDYLRDTPAAVRFVSFEPLLGSVCSANLREIDWAIVGGESGPKAREMQEIWVSEIEDLCRKSQTAFFFKQWGGVNKKKSGRVFRGKTYDEMPLSQTV